MKLRFCNCRMCRYGRKHYGNPAMINRKKRAARHKVKQLIKQGDFEKIPEAVSIPYTD